jgi:hypothetical protein
MTSWISVPGYEYIEVTRDGRARSVSQQVTRTSRWGTQATYNFRPRELRTWLSTNGYFRVVVQRNGKRGPLYLHRLIAMAFVPGYQRDYHVNHINGVKTDNRPENLEWVPNERNVRHAWEAGLTGINRASVLNPQRVRAIRKALSLGVPANTIAVIAGVARDTITKIQDGKTWQSVQG